MPELDPQREIFFKDYLAPGSLKLPQAIQSAGRKLIVTRVAPFQVAPLLEALSPDGLLMSIDASSPEEADRLEAFTLGLRRT